MSPRHNFPQRAMRLIVALTLTLAFAQISARAQQPPTSTDRDRARTMLRTIKEDLKKNYYDENVRGIDLDARFQVAEEKVKTAQSLGQLMGIIAQVLVDLGDSHTYFYPPGRISSYDYGWQMQMIGDKCYVVAVKPGSDADKKGLRPGDLVATVDGRQPTIDNLHLLKYMYYTLRPQPGMRLAIQKPDGKEQQIDVLAKVRTGKRVTDLTDPNEWFKIMRESENEERLNRHRYYEIGEDLFIWKMPAFDMLEEDVNKMADKFRKHKALILDLRGNGGGYVINLERLLGYFFDHDVKIADLKGRKEMKPQMAKTRGDKTFKGQLVVLIDSQSGSASELFARVVQLEKRGTVIGDRSAGAVMQSRHHGHQIGIDVVVFYGVSITNADVIMTDGKSLESVGVTPDMVMLPTAADLAAGHDPVLAKAAELVGFKMDAAKAGSMFPVEWRK